MANEIIITEYGAQVYRSGGKPVQGALPKQLKSTFVSLGDTHQVDQSAGYVTVEGKEGSAAFQFTIGDAAVSLNANDAGNRYVSSGGSNELPIEKNTGDYYIKTVADA